MRNNTRNIIIYLLLFVLGIVFTTGCSKAKMKGIINDKKSEIKINIGGDPVLVDPQMASTIAENRTVCMLYEGLFRKDLKGIPIPAVAEKVDISDDGLVYTFTLKSVKWSDGTFVTAEDFRTAWLRALNPRPAKNEYFNCSSMFFCIKGAKEYKNGVGRKDDVAIKAKDEKTLEVMLESPVTQFLSMVCNPAFMPVNKSFYYKFQNDEKDIFGTKIQTIMGNGPYIIKEWERGKSIILEKNPNYWNKDNLKIDIVNLVMMKDSNEALKAFKDGDLALIGINSEEQKEQIEAAGGKIVEMDSDIVETISFNLSDKIMSNTNVRKGLGTIINRENFVNNVVKKNAVKAYGLISSNVFGINNNFRIEAGNLFDDSNPEQAKVFINQGTQELGYTALPKMKILVQEKKNSKTGDDNFSARRDSIAVYETWTKELYANIEIISETPEGFMQKLVSGDFQIALMPWTTEYNEPLTLLENFVSNNPSNICRYSNQEYDALIQKAKYEKNRENKVRLLMEAEKKLIDDMVISPLYFTKSYYAVNKKVKNLVRANSVEQELDIYWASVDE